MNSTRLGLSTATATALLTLLAGCASPAATPTAAPSVPASSASTAAAAHNDADTAFAQMMVVHHEGAIEMAALAESKARSEEVRSLAARIRAAQGPEIDQMRSWLKAWGEPAPEDSDMGGMDHGGMDMGGLDQEAAMAELNRLDGVAFDREFLRLMIAHHEGAVLMAREEIGGGTNPGAVALARAIITAQEKEILQMQALAEQLR